MKTEYYFYQVSHEHRICQDARNRTAGQLRAFRTHKHSYQLTRLSPNKYIVYMRSRPEDMYIIQKAKP
jgi:hypothetical protein